MEVQSVAVVRVRTAIYDAKAKADAAALSCADLMSILLRERQQTPHEAAHGQKALIRLVRAQQLAVDLGSDLFRVHDELSTVGIERGVLDEPDSTRKSGMDDADPQRAVAS